jgi:hypothetical protein
MSPRGLAPPADVAAAAALVVRDYMAVRAGEDVLITADTGTDLALAEALMSAVTQAGARPSLLTIPRLPFQGRAPSAVRPGTPIETLTCGFSGGTVILDNAVAAVASVPSRGRSSFARRLSVLPCW